MILEVSPESSALVRGAAATVLFLHIAGGTIGIVSGVAALSMHKGGRAHRIVGNVFFVSMLIMSAIGAAVSPFLPKPDWVNVVGGLFTFYLVATAWMTANRTQVGRLEFVALAFGFVTALGGLAVWKYGPIYPELLGDDGHRVALMFGSLAALATLGDLRMIFNGGVAGRPRISRHVWRMCLALFIAVGSLFGGQPQLFPESWRTTGVLMLPVLATLITMFYWMVRVRFTVRWREIMRSN